MKIHRCLRLFLFLLTFCRVRSVAVQRKYLSFLVMFLTLVMSMVVCVLLVILSVSLLIVLMMPQSFGIQELMIFHFDSLCFMPKLSQNYQRIQKPPRFIQIRTVSRFFIRLLVLHRRRLLSVLPRFVPCRTQSSH